MSINQNQYRPCVGHRDLADKNRDWVKVVLVVSRNSALLRGLLAQIDLDSVGRFYFAGFSLKLLLCGVFVKTFTLRDFRWRTDEYLGLGICHSTAVHLYKQKIGENGTPR